MDAAALRADARTLGRDLRRAIPDTYRAYGELHKAVLAPGALSTKAKELIALTIAITRECDGCIAAHAEGAARSGATTEEVAEAIGVAILMNGGPATVYGPRAYRAFRDVTEAGSPGGNAAHVEHDRQEPAGPMGAATVTGDSGDPIEHPTGDAGLDKLLHDLEVANDCGPSHRRHVRDS